MKHLRLLFIPFIILASMIFSSCDGDIKIKAYVSDLDSIARNKEKILYEKVRIFAGGINSRDKDQIAFLKENINGFENEHDEEINYVNGLSFDMKIPVINLKDKDKFSSRNDFMVIYADETSDALNFYFDYYEPVFQKIDDYIFSKNLIHIKPEDFSVSVEINNDFSKEVMIYASSVYVNKAPYPGVFEKNLAGHDYVSLSLSQIVRDSIARNNSWIAFSIRK